MTFEEILKKDRRLVYKTRGTSMLPMLRQGRDLVIIEPLKRRPQLFDVVLYRRADGAHVLHRIIKVRKSDYVIRGDHTYRKETGITDQDIEGILTAFVRNGRQYHMTDPEILLYGRIWNLLFPLRLILWRFYRFLQVQVFGKKSNPERKHEIYEEKWNTARRLCGLLACSVRGETPGPAMTDSLDYAKLLVLSDKNAVSSAAGMALYSAGIKEPGFQRAVAKAVRNTALMDRERSTVYHRLEQDRIWYAPLKGAVLKELYPKFGMREMSDTDILVDASRIDDVRRLMSEVGFEFVKEEETHDVFFKSPNCTFEIHKRLFNPKGVPALDNYFRNARSMLIHSGEETFQLAFRPADLYIYHLAHEWKHFDGNGTGLRSLMDTYALLHRYGNLPQQEYVRNKLDELGLLDFEKQNRELTLHLFENGELSDSAQKMGDRILSSGTFGSMNQKISRAVEQHGGGIAGMFRYLRDRIFLPEELIRARHPFFWEHRFLIPFLPIYRLVVGIKNYRGSILREIRALFQGMEE